MTETTSDPPARLHATARTSIHLFALLCRAFLCAEQGWVVPADYPPSARVKNFSASKTATRPHRSVTAMNCLCRVHREHTGISHEFKKKESQRRRRQSCCCWRGSSRVDEEERRRAFCEPEESRTSTQVRRVFSGKKGFAQGVQGGKSRRVRVVGSKKKKALHVEHALVSEVVGQVEECSRESPSGDPRQAICACR